MDEATARILDAPDPRAGECIYDRQFVLDFWEKVARWDRDDELAAQDRADEEAEIVNSHVSTAVDTVLSLAVWRQGERERASEVWFQLKALGCIVFVQHGSLRIEPLPLVPADLLELATSYPICVYLEGFTDEPQARSNLPAL